MIKRLRATLADRRGATAIVFGITLPVILGMAGLGVEVGEWYLLKRRAQTAADAGAFAGALDIAQNANAKAKTDAIRESTRNGYTEGDGVTVTVNIPPLSGSQVGNAKAVEVIIAQQPPLLFAKLFFTGTQTIQARAVGTVTQTGSACLLALDSSKKRALEVTGSAVVTMNECSFGSNSTNAESMYFSGSAEVSAASAWSAGGIVQGGSSVPSFTGGTLAYSWPVTDPYSSLTIPSTLAACDAAHKAKTYSGTISEGVYCDGIEVKSNNTLTLNPGTYYINQGDFKVGSQATVTCNCSAATDGVTIVLTSTGNASKIGSVDINGQAHVTLQAPTGSSYPYPGVLFFQDPKASSKTVNKLNGGSNLNLTGTLYFPSSPVDWNGNSTAKACTQIIADTITISGNTTLSSSGCAALGITPISLTFSGLTE